MCNSNGVLNERVVTKLSIQPPAAYLVQTYLERICQQHEVNWKPSVSLSAAQMCEPMAAPSGFSVPVGQATGLGLVAASTGIESAESMKNDDTTINSGSVMTEVTATPVLPTAPSAPTSGGGDFDEVDLYIPAAPGHQNAKPSAPSAKSDDDDDKKNNNNNIPPPAPGANGGGADGSYADLAARFDNLQNL